MDGLDRAAFSKAWLHKWLIRSQRNKKKRILYQNKKGDEIMERKKAGNQKNQKQP